MQKNKYHKAFINYKYKLSLLVNDFYEVTCILPMGLPA